MLAVTFVGFLVITMQHALTASVGLLIAVDALSRDMALDLGIYILRLFDVWILFEGIMSGFLVHWHWYHLGINLKFSDYTKALLKSSTRVHWIRFLLVAGFGTIACPPLLMTILRYMNWPSIFAIPAVRSALPLRMMWLYSSVSAALCMVVYYPLLYIDNVPEVLRAAFKKMFKVGWRRRRGWGWAKGRHRNCDSV